MKEEGIYLRPSAFICGPHSSEGRIHLRPSARSAVRIHLRLRMRTAPGWLPGPPLADRTKPLVALMADRSWPEPGRKQLKQVGHGGARALVGNCCSSGRGRRWLRGWSDGSGSGHRMRRVRRGIFRVLQSPGGHRPGAPHHVPIIGVRGVVNVIEQGPGAFPEEDAFLQGDLHDEPHFLGAHLVRN